jgi:hypothetical protein
MGRAWTIARRQGRWSLTSTVRWVFFHYTPLVNYLSTMTTSCLSCEDHLHVCTWHLKITNLQQKINHFDNYRRLSLHMSLYFLYGDTAAVWAGIFPALQRKDKQSKLCNTQKLFSFLCYLVKAHPPPWRTILWKKKICTYKVDFAVRSHLSLSFNSRRIPLPMVLFLNGEADCDCQSPSWSAPSLVDTEAGREGGAGWGHIHSRKIRLIKDDFLIMVFHLILIKVSRWTDLLSHWLLLAGLSYLYSTGFS